MYIVLLFISFLIFYNLVKFLIYVRNLLNVIEYIYNSYRIIILFQTITTPIFFSINMNPPNLYIKNFILNRKYLLK